METLNKIKVCKRDELAPFEGKAALIDGEQVALFFVPSKGVFAVQNWDPFGKAHVISRGIVGDKSGQLCVASPLYKHHFSLSTGRCIEEDSVSLKCWQVETDSDYIYLCA